MVWGVETSDHAVRIPHRPTPFRKGRLRLALGAALCLLALPGCPEPPEQCAGCLVVLLDAAIVSDDGAAAGADALGGVGGGASPGSGGAPVGSGGSPGTGGAIISGTGGVSTGGTGTGGQAQGSGGAVVVSSGGVGAGTGGNPGTGGAVATGGAAAPGSGGGAGSVPSDLVLWYKFDDGMGTTAADSAMFGGTSRPGTLSTIGAGGTATFSTQKQLGSYAVSLTPAATAGNANGGFVSAASVATLAPEAMTISVWARMAANTAAQNWSRVFDFGSGTGTAPNFYLAARASDAPNTPIRFAITNSGHTATAEQRLDGPSTLTPNVWHHLAVVLPAGTPYTGTLYIDGVAVATNKNMTLHAADLGATTNNWLGRSQFSAASGTNPCFNGGLDDFRVYRRALSAAEITALYQLR